MTNKIESRVSRPSRTVTSESTKPVTPSTPPPEPRVEKDGFEREAAARDPRMQTLPHRGLATVAAEIRASRASQDPQPGASGQSAVQKIVQGALDAIQKAVQAALGGAQVTPADGGIDLSASGSFSTEIENAKGYGVSFGISADASVVSNQETKDGVTSFSVETDASVKLEGGVSTPQAGVEVAHTEGIRSSYEVRMPEAAAQGVDPASVNPFDPASMPTGTVITLDGARYTSNEFSATFKNLAIATKVTNEQGVSVAVEKTGPSTVRVTAGPTEAIEAYNGVGVDFDVASVMLGRNDRLASATLKTAEFDLSTPEGKAAYNDFLATGKLPAQNGTGISDVATVEKLDYSSQTELGISVGSFELNLEGAKNTGSRVVTTLPDGTVSVSTDLQYSGNVPMNVTAKYDKDGKEILSERRYTYTLTADENTAQLLNVAITGSRDAARSGPVQAGKAVTLQFTEDQMRAYMEMTQRASNAGMGNDTDLNALVKDYDGNFIDSPQDFALALARNLNGGDYSQALRMFTISDLSDGEVDDHFSKLPGTFVVG